MITRETITSLLDQASDPSISIYLPTHVKGEEVQQDPIRFKNALQKADQQLQSHDVEPPVIENLLAEPRKLLDNPLFWQHNERGLAVFITPGDFEYYRLPLDFKEQVMVQDHFLITPLLPLVSLDGAYCILGLSQKNIRLLKCTRETVETINLKNAPDSLEEFLRFDESEKHLQVHSNPGGHSAVFHGQGSSKDTETHQVINYLKTIENEVTSNLRKRNDPLVLAGVKKAVAEYKKMNHYSRLMDEAIIENPDPLSDKTINEKGWGIIKSHFLKDMYEALNQFEDLINSDKQSDSLTQVVQSSHYGKVDSLFVPVGEQSWGRFDSEQDTVHHSLEQRNGDYDLINMAAIQTLYQGGNVYALDKEDMPQQAAIAAIFRYS